MSSKPDQASKRDERRVRNLESAKASRERRREWISALTEEKARLEEANALLRVRLNISPSAALPPAASVTGSSSARNNNLAELGPTMQAVLRRKEIDGPAAIDLLNRAVHGGKGRGTPLDPDAGRRFAEAARKAPKDVRRPLKHTPPSNNSGSKSTGKASSRSKVPYGGTKKK